MSRELATVLGPMMLLAVLGSACSESGAARSRFQELQQAVLLPRCADRGCHDIVGHKGNLTFEGDGAHSQLVHFGADGGAVVVAADNLAARQDGWVRVLPGEPDESFLIRKVEGPDEDQGEAMPRNDEPLSSIELAMIRRWIEEGALP